MSEFNQLYDDEFFLITSDNLSDVNTKFYGYTIIDNNILYNIDDSDVEKLNGEGSYIFVLRKENEIHIYQDFIGCYGLYLYNQNGFAISNSFYKLTEYLKNKVKLNYDYDVANSFLSASMCSIAYKKTLIKDITCLSKDDIVNINIKTKELSFSTVNYHERSINLDSKECLEILDEWFYKWINFFNILYNQTKNIQIELSGGYDTRIILGLIRYSNVDLNEINVYSSQQDHPIKSADYKITKVIAKKLGFTLNKGIQVPKYNFQELETSINLSYYLKLGFCKQIYWKTFKYMDKFYTIGGLGSIKEFYQSFSRENFILNSSNRASYYSKDCKDSTKRILEYDFDEYEKILGDNVSLNDLFERHFRLVRNRNHFGRMITESYLSNNIRLAPLMDPLIQKLKIHTVNYYKNRYYLSEKDENLLVAIIFLRYFPELLKFDVEGGRKFNKETILLAMDINNIKPFYLDVSKFDLYKQKGEIFCEKDTEFKKMYSNAENKRNVVYSNSQELSRKVFTSEKFKKIFESNFSEKIYNKISYKLNYTKINPYEEVNASIGLVKFLKDTEMGVESNTPYDFLKTFVESSNKNKTSDKLKIKKEYNNNLINNYKFARIDMKNMGSIDNDIELVEISDINANITKPKWFTNSEGVGLQIESFAYSLDYKIKCIKDGNLRLKLRSKSVTDKRGKRLPIFIEYQTLSINSDLIFDDRRLVSHDRPLIYLKKVKDGEILHFHIEWKPQNKKSLLKKNRKVTRLSSSEDYETALINIKNYGIKTNKVELIDISDNKAEIIKPKWFKSKEGVGLQIKSSKRIMDLEFKCKNNGSLKIDFRSKNVLDVKNNAQPLNIIYENIIINSKNFINEEKNVNYFNGLTFKKEVHDNEIIRLHLEWRPFNVEYNSKELKYEKPFEIPIENKQKNNALLNKYKTARIDIKNKGTKDNEIEILDLSDANVKVRTPKWFTNKFGKGQQLESQAYSLDVKLKCINDGKLKVNLRSINNTDIKGNSIPIFIEYTKFVVNSKNVLKYPKVATHDKGIFHIKKVKNNEIIDLHIEWKPIDKSSKL